MRPRRVPRNHLFRGGRGEAVVTCFNEAEARASESPSFAHVRDERDKELQ